MKGSTPRTFPLRVNQAWLDRIDSVRKVTEAKHDFVLNAVEKEVKQRERENNDTK